MYAWYTSRRHEDGLLLVMAGLAMVTLESAIASPCLFAYALLEAHAVFAPSSRKSPKKVQSHYTRADMGKIRLRLR